MIVSARLRPRDFFDMFFYGLKDRPLRSALALLLPLLLINSLFGFTVAFLIAAAFAVGVITVYYLAAAFLYIVLHAKDRTIPVTYRISNASIKITYGNPKTLLRYSRTLKHKETGRVWVYGRWIYLQYTYATYRMFVPREKRTKFILELNKRGWLTPTHQTLKNRLVFNAGHVGMYAFVGLLFLATFWAGSHASSAAYKNLPPVTVTAQGITARLNNERAANSLPVLQPDSSLLKSATMACEGITNQNKPGGKPNASLTDGAAHVSQYYTQQWVTQIAVSVPATTTTGGVVAKWINNHDAADAILDGEYTTGNVATCSYTTHGAEHTVVVLDLSR